MEIPVSPTRYTPLFTSCCGMDSPSIEIAACIPHISRPERFAHPMAMIPDRFGFAQRSQIEDFGSPSPRVPNLLAALRELAAQAENAR